VPLRGGVAPRPRAAVRDRRALLLLALPLAGGAGLAVHLLADVDLRLAVAALAGFGAAIWLVLVPRLPAARRATIRRRVAVGAGCGLLATGAYDAARYGLVALAQFSFEPFHVFALFGELFLGPGASPASRFAVGTLYHLLNGTGFGIAYLLAVRRPRVITGLVWGVLLELAMATLYPPWLRMQQLGEFLQVSAAGHLVYGSVLGGLAGRWLAVGADPAGPSLPSAGQGAA
jgi:hypothetical protein